MAHLHPVKISVLTCRLKLVHSDDTRLLFTCPQTDMSPAHAADGVAVTYATFVNSE